MSNKNYHFMNFVAVCGSLRISISVTDAHRSFNFYDRQVYAHEDEQKEKIVP